MNTLHTSKLSSQSKSETIFRNRNVQNKFSVRQVVGAAIFGKDDVGLDKFAYDHQHIQVPKMEVLNYVSSMDTAYVRESPPPKTAENKVQETLQIRYLFTFGDMKLFHDDYFSWITLPETNIAPEKWWLEYYFPIGKVTFQGLR